MTLSELVFQSDDSDQIIFHESDSVKEQKSNNNNEMRELKFLFLLRFCIQLHFGTGVSNFSPSKI